MSLPAVAGALLALVLAPAAGVGQEPGPTAGDEAAVEKMERIRGRLGPDAVAGIEEAMRAAREAGVPAGPVADKALEGIAKGVSPGRLVPAVEAYVERLIRAAGVLGEAPPPAEIVAAADALGRGVPEGELRAVSGSAPPEDRAIALVVLGDLVEMGVPPDRAAGAVQDALSAGRSGEVLLQLPALVRRRLRAGTPPGRAAEEARQALERGPPVPPRDRSTGKR